jgi:phytoene dehydrogenase-like protein
MSDSAGDSRYDAIVIGAGHNGLVSASYLARAGRRVLVLEARDVVGGACTTEELIPGARWSSCAFIAGLLRPEIIAELELRSFGLELYQADVESFSLFRDGSHMFMYPELDRTLREIEAHSPADARAFLDFGLRMQRFSHIITPFLMRSPPTRSEVLRAFEDAGEPELFDEFVLLSTKDLLDRYFESDHVKGHMTYLGMVSVWGGPSTPGTAYTYGHHSWGEFEGQFGQWGFARGGMGGISQALAAAAEHHGAEIRLGTRVAEVVVDGGRVHGVRLESGELIGAPVVVSNADPKASMLGLLPEGALAPAVRERVQGIDMRGSMGRIHLLIDELPAYVGFDGPAEGLQHRGHQLLGATIENFELGFEAMRRGEFPDEFVIEAVIQSLTDASLSTPGRDTMTLGVQQLPYHLAEGDWDSRKDEWTQLVLESLFAYAPNLRDHIIDQVTITPLDIERDYGLTEGNIFHGAMFLDQLFSSRPLPELSGYRTPVAGYYLCGAGTHPGGGVMGASGHNAAQVVLDDMGGGPPSNATAVHTVPPRGRTIIHRVMETDTGRRAGYALARQKMFRPVARLAARRRGA